MLLQITAISSPAPGPQTLVLEIFGLKAAHRYKVMTSTMATIKTRVEDGKTFFYVSWKYPGTVSAKVCEQDVSVFHDIADAVMARKISKKARSRPWSMVLELSREAICKTGDLDDYFSGLADVLYRALFDGDSDVPESIEIAWPASEYEGVYRVMTYSPAYEDDPDNTT